LRPTQGKTAGSYRGKILTQTRIYIERGNGEIAKRGGRERPPDPHRNISRESEKPFDEEPVGRASAGGIEQSNDICMNTFP